MEITVEKALKECGALLEGHFLLTSGRHSGQYLEKAEICADPIITDDFCWQIAQGVVGQFKAVYENRIEVVVGLAPIGANLSSRVAEHLWEIYQEKVTSVFTEKNEEGKMVFRRGYARKIRGKRVLIVDDTLTTGGSLGEVKMETEKQGGLVSGLAIICKRGEVRSKDLEGVPILCIAELTMEDCLPEDCLQCAENIPLVDPKAR